MSACVAKFSMRTGLLVLVPSIALLLLAATPATAGQIEGTERLLEHPKVERTDQAAPGAASDEKITGGAWCAQRHHYH